jgi:hypothetical protein
MKQSVPKSTPVTHPIEGTARFKERLKKHFSLRLHMVFILLGVFFSGLIASKILLELGLTSMLVRYLLVVVFSYVMFFLFIKVWFRYIAGRSARRHRVRDDSGSIIDLDGIPLGSGESVHGGGGEYSGGGASGDFDLPDRVDDSANAAASATLSESVATSGSSSGDSILPDIDLGSDDGGVVFVILGILFALIFGAAAYVVAQAPDVLADATVQLMLASGLIRASRQMDNPGWVGSVLKATCIPFMIVLVLSIIIACVATSYCPEANKLLDVLKKL